MEDSIQYHKDCSMNKLIKLFLLPILFCVISLSQASVSAASTDQKIIFDSFTGVYHLSRDSRGLSLLTSDETIVGNFPSSGFTGIKRVLSEKFQGHSVSIKILSVTDAAGSPIPYTVLSDNNDVTLTIGDSSITLSGSQTIRINYQTRGVINLSKKYDELLLGINGRGWSEPFTKVNASLYISAQFNSKIQGNPSCYTALNSTNDSSNCQIAVSKTADSTVITSRALQVSANQALVIKVDFLPQTFTNNHSQFIVYIVLVIITFTAFILVYARLNKKRKSRKL